MQKLKLLASHAVNIARDDRYRRHFLQRRVKGNALRAAAAKRAARNLPPPSAYAANDLITALDQDGYVMTPNIVTPEQVEAMRAYFTGRPVRDNYRPDSPVFRPPFEKAPPGTHVAFYQHKEVASCPHALDLANSPILLNTVAISLGVKPIASYITAWWSLPARDGAQHAELFHRDVDDYDWVKFFLYLTDVDEDAGPHVYIAGSHRDERLTEVRRYTDMEVYDTFGRDREVRFTGPAGTAFLERTYGVHRGVPPITKPRLVFQVLYSMTPSIYGPRRPIIDLPMNYDPYVNQVYCRQA